MEGTGVGTKPSFDQVFDYVGPIGLFQYFLLLVVSLQGMMLSWHHLGYVFLGAVPDHWCKVTGFDDSDWTVEEIRNLSIPMTSDGIGWETCKYYDLDYTSFAKLPYESAMREISSLKEVDETFATKPCKDWVFDTGIYSSTLVTEFRIVCEDRYLVATIQATYMCGVFLGSLIIGSLSDRIIGRRNSVLLSILIVAIGGIGASFASSYLALVTLRFIIAFGVAGAYQNCYVLLMEYTGPKSRSTMGMVSQLPFAVGSMMMAFYAYFIRDWHMLQLAFSVTGLTLVIYFWILPESARWLAVSGKPEKALQLLLRVAYQNQKKVEQPGVILEIVRSCSDDRTRRTAVHNIAESVPPEPPRGWRESLKKLWGPLQGTASVYWSLVATPEMRKRTLLIWLLFITVDLVYYGVIFDSVTLTKDPHLLVFLGGLSEIPAYTLFVPCLTKFGRRTTIVATLFITGMCTFFVAVFPQDYLVLRTCASMSGKMFITATFAVTYLLGAELYPTAIRTTGLAAGVFMGRVGSISAPYLVDSLKPVSTSLPNIIFGIACILTSLISTLLPETKDLEMADQLEDIEAEFLPTRDRESNVSIVAIEEEPSNDPMTEDDAMELQHLTSSTDT